MNQFYDKKDRLERFVRDNREGFDRLEPNALLWERIESKLGDAEPEPKAASGRNGRAVSWGRAYFDWRMAACLLLTLGMGYLYYLNNQYGVTRDPQVALNAPAYARQVTQYNQAIEQKRDELIRLTTDTPDLYKEFSSDLDRLEKSYSNLRSELPESPDQEALVQAMIQNLRWQIDLLNQQLSILQRIKKAEQSHENNILI